MEKTKTKTKKIDLSLETLKAKGVFCHYVTKHKKNWKILKGFFYRDNTVIPELKEQLTKAFPSINIVNDGCVWKPFVGGTPVQKSSHYWIEFNFEIGEV